MQSRKFILPVLLAALFSVAPASAAMKTMTAKAKPERAVECGGASGCTRDLVAGQNIVVGTVNVAVSDDSLVVTYQITNLEWWITDIHFEVSTDPITKSAPGRFSYKPSLNGPTQMHEIVLDEPIPTAECSEGFDGYYYAAHAVVGRYENIVELPDLGDPEALEYPDVVDLTVQFVGGSGPGYFVGTVAGDPPTLNGSYDTFCVDLTRTISSGTPYSAAVLSSYEEISTDHVQVPENFPKVNWILNNREALSASCSAGTADIQGSIWKLISTEETFNAAGCDLGQCGGISFLPATVECVIDAATQNESMNGDYRPGCGDSVAVVLVPFATASGAAISAQTVIAVAQVTTITVPTVCEPNLVFTGQEETAWGCGDFIDPKKNWAMSFTCCAN